MRREIIFTAFDGTEFRDETTALDYEKRLGERLESVYQTLPKRYLRVPFAFDSDEYILIKIGSLTDHRAVVYCNDGVERNSVDYTTYDGPGCYVYICDNGGISNVKWESFIGDFTNAIYNFSAAHAAISEQEAEIR